MRWHRLNPLAAVSARRWVRIHCGGLRQECPDPDALRASRIARREGSVVAATARMGLGNPFRVPSADATWPFQSVRAVQDPHAMLLALRILAMGTLATQAPELAMQIVDAADDADLAAEIFATNVNRVALAGRLCGRARRPVGQSLSQAVDGRAGRARSRHAVHRRREGVHPRERLNYRQRGCIATSWKSGPGSYAVGSGCWRCSGCRRLWRRG